MRIRYGAEAQGKRHYSKGKGKKGAGVATASAGEEFQPCIPMKLPSSRVADIKVMAVGLGAANTILPYLLCADPMLPLVATLAIFKATLDSNFTALKDKEQVFRSGDYLAKQLATAATIVDKSMPTVAVLYDSMLCSKRGR